MSVFTFGETMGLISADGIGPLPYARSFTYGIGGSESNTAIGIARLGGDVTWLGRVGSDGTGALIAHRLRAEGVHTRAIVDDGVGMDGAAVANVTDAAGDGAGLAAAAEPQAAKSNAKKKTGKSAGL